MKYALVLVVGVCLLSCRTPPLSGSTEESQREQLTVLLEEIQASYRIPAIGVIVLDSNHIIDSVTIGRRDISRDDAATSENYFHLGSNTKAITAFIAAELVREGKIEWDTKLFDLVPALAEKAHQGYSEVTLSDLLSHRGWIPAYATAPDMAHIPPLKGDVVEQRLRFSEYVLRDPPTHRSLLSRFRRYAYSNAGYVIAAVMLERASGESWESLVERVMVGDLGLRVHVGFPVEVGPDQPRGHLPGAYLGQGKDTVVVYDTEYVLTHEEVLSPAGNLSMPMTDYARFVQLNLRGLRGADSYLPAETYRYLHFGREQYAMGWENGRQRGVEYSEHSGSRGNFFCHVRIIPEHDLAIIAFANSGIINALSPVARLFDGLRLRRYFERIEVIYSSSGG